MKSSLQKRVSVDVLLFLSNTLNRCCSLFPKSLPFSLRYLCPNPNLIPYFTPALYLVSSVTPMLKASLKVLTLVIGLIDNDEKEAS